MTKTHPLEKGKAAAAVPPPGAPCEPDIEAHARWEERYSLGRLVDIILVTSQNYLWESSTESWAIPDS